VLLAEAPGRTDCLVRRRPVAESIIAVDSRPGSPDPGRLVFSPKGPQCMGAWAAGLATAIHSFEFLVARTMCAANGRAAQPIDITLCSGGELPSPRTSESPAAPSSQAGEHIDHVEDRRSHQDDEQRR